MIFGMKNKTSFYPSSQKFSWLCEIEVNSVVICYHQCNMKSNKIALKVNLPRRKGEDLIKKWRRIYHTEKNHWFVSFHV